MRVPDERAVRILLDAYWNGSGWRAGPRVSDEDRDFAVDAGVMFPSPRTASHEEIVAGVLDVASTITQQEVVDCFLASLSSRRLDLRSSLGSFGIARHLQPHPYEPGVDRTCAVCGLLEGEETIDLNVMNFERFKWGGVRRDDLTYVWLDLQQFAAADRPRPTAADRASFRQLLGVLAELPAGTTATRAAGRSWPGIPSNKAEREVLLDVLGVCSVLEAPGHPGYADHFVAAADRADPPYRYVERAYPVCWWRSEYGVNRQVTERLGL